MSTTFRDFHCFSRGKWIQKCGQHLSIRNSFNCHEVTKPQYSNTRSKQKEIEMDNATNSSIVGSKEESFELVITKTSICMFALVCP